METLIIQATGKVRDALRKATFTQQLLLEAALKALSRARTRFLAGDEDTMRMELFWARAHIRAAMREARR